MSFIAFVIGLVAGVLLVTWMPMIGWWVHNKLKLPVWGGMNPWE